MDVMDTPALQEFAGCDWVLWGGGQATLVHPVLYPVEVDGCPGLLVPTKQDKWVSVEGDGEEERRTG